MNSTSLPQKFSRDLYVRLRAHELFQLELVHLYSEVFNAAPSQPISGATEWCGAHGEGRISLGWDWVLKNDGAPIHPSPATLRSNIMLISDKGYDLGPDTTSAVCEQVVGGIPWSTAVMTVLHQKLH